MELSLNDSQGMGMLLRKAPQSAQAQRDRPMAAQALAVTEGRTGSDPALAEKTIEQLRLKAAVNAQAGSVDAGRSSASQSHQW